MADRSVFDGYSLTLYRSDGSIVGSWPAISGRSGNQRPSDQNLAFKGPLTEGSYSFSTDNIQSLTRRDRMLGLVGRGHFPGSTAAWGTERVELVPDSTSSNGRNHFFIHGGFTPGSAGCIDLGPNEKAYFDALRSDGESSHEVVVSYDPRLETSPHPLAGNSFWNGASDYLTRPLRGLDHSDSFDSRFENWGSAPAGIVPPPASDRPVSFDDRFADWGSFPAGNSSEPNSPMLRELEKTRRSAAPGGAVSPSAQGVTPATPAFEPDAVYSPDGNFYGNFPAASAVAAPLSPAAFNALGPGFGSRTAVDFNSLAQAVTRLLSGAGGFTGNSLIPPANAASSSRPPLTPTVPGFPAATPTTGQSNPAYFPGWNGHSMEDPIGSPVSQASIFDTGAPAVPLGGVLKYFNERMVPPIAQEPAGRFLDSAAGTDPEPVRDTPTNVAPGLPRLTRMVSSAFAGSNPPNPTPAPQPGQPLGLFTGEPMPDWSVPPPIFDFGDRRGQQDAKGIVDSVSRRIHPIPEPN
jgi:hypothetical protein